MIRVMLVDDQRLVRAGFASILGDEEDIELVAEAGNGAEALELARRHRPDVALMDIRMPDMDGLEATERIGKDPKLDGVKVVILTTFDEDDYVYRALRAGASGFLVKDTDPDELIHAIRVVAAGDALISPKVTRRLIGEFAGRIARPEPSSKLNALTERETEVLKLVATGMSNDEIAGALFLSPATAKTHVSRIMSKLSARDRAQLVVTAYESGLVRPTWTDGE
ncbi:response regulator transcription factor [Glycomyces luteolus]|uniref:Response regulator transcription factor n=1 Tax=Glycomyces luteolus TaxID=2670330 RepID=A0A9X3P6X4_9ACTN|nr:response regulator transcription factor [Glycomyces luteolus]MDA1358277.1 response regulator transcription factor [Glycomyces luteolus]